MSLRIVAGAALGALIVPVAVLAQDASGDAARNWSAIAACGAIQNPDGRHDCVDDVLQAAGVLTPEQAAQGAREDFGRENRSERSVAEAPRATAPQPSAAPAAPAQAAAAQPRRAEDLDSIVTTVASLRTIGYQKLRVTTAEGSVWDQTQAAEFNTTPREGDRFSVERAAMNSFLCQIGRSRRYRCERID